MGVGSLAVSKGLLNLTGFQLIPLASCHDAVALSVLLFVVDATAPEPLP